jgi:SAM-dependent methyltransferase
VIVPAAQRLRDANRLFYDRLWGAAMLVPPERFNTWALLRDLPAQSRLEVGPGLRPRLPVQGTHFVDVSARALSRLRDQHGLTVLGDVTALPFADAAFDLICALDVVEHVEDDDDAIAELARVARPGAVLLLSVPLHAARWSDFDALVGHRRRYEPAALLDLLAAHRFAVRQSAAFGMRPRASALANVGGWFLRNQPGRALWWYNRVLMPLGLRRQKPLALRDGLIETAGIDEILLLCHRLPEAPPAEAPPGRLKTVASCQGTNHASEPA